MSTVRADSICRSSFICYLKSNASIRHRGTRLSLSLTLQILRALMVLPHAAVQSSDNICKCMHVNTAPISRAKGYCEQQENKTTLHVGASDHLNFFKQVVWRHFMVLFSDTIHTEASGSYRAVVKPENSLTATP